MVTSPDPSSISPSDLFDRSPCRTDDAGPWGTHLFRSELGPDGLPLHGDGGGGVFWRMLGVHPPGAESGDNRVTNFDGLVTDRAVTLIPRTYWHEKILEPLLQDRPELVKSSVPANSSNHKLRGNLE